MTLRLVGAGLGRTGTASLKQALELLLDARCYHMFEVFENPRHDVVWHSAVNGGPVDWNAFLGDYAATVDWPACAFWRDLCEANPDAVVLLSTRESAGQWWASMERTIVSVLTGSAPDPVVARHREMVRDLLARRFTPDWRDADAAMAAYERHNEEVRREADPARLIEWRPGDAWEPLCAALGVAVPSTPFPHENTTADFRTRQGLGDA